MFEHFVSLSDWNLRQLTPKRKAQTIIVDICSTRLYYGRSKDAFLIRLKPLIAFDVIFHRTILDDNILFEIPNLRINYNVFVLKLFRDKIIII